MYKRYLMLYNRTTGTSCQMKYTQVNCGKTIKIILITFQELQSVDYFFIFYFWEKNKYKSSCTYVQAIAICISQKQNSPKCVTKYKLTSSHPLRSRPPVPPEGSPLIGSSPSTQHTPFPIPQWKSSGVSGVRIEQLFELNLQE